MTNNIAFDPRKLDPVEPRGHDPPGKKSEAGQFKAELEAAQKTSAPVCVSSQLNSRPTSHKLAAGSSELSEKLTEVMGSAGLSRDPPILLNLKNGQVTVSGDRDDLVEVERLIQANPDIIGDLEKVSTMAGEMYGFIRDGHLAFQREFRLTDGSSETVAKFSHLFDDRALRAPPEVVITFSSQGLSQTCDGTPVSPEYFRRNPNWLEADVDPGRAQVVHKDKESIAEKQETLLAGLTLRQLMKN